MSDFTNSRHSKRDEEPENLSMLLSSTEEDEREGFLGLTVEHEELTDEERRRIHKRRRNTLITAMLVFGVALVLIVAVLAPQYGWFKRKDYRGDGNGTEVSYSVDSGVSMYQIAADLENRGIIADANRFVETYNDMGEDLFIQPGDYQLQEKMSSEAALNTLLQLDRADQIYVAVNQTLRMNETFDNLSKTTGIPVGEFNKLNDNLEQFGIPSQFPTLEGWLHPGEYHFDPDASATEIVQTMVDRTKQDLADAGVEGDDRIFHVLTVASILEFEGIPSDYAPIAGAIENRMNNPEGETGGYLQSDATVAYGLGEKTYELTTEQKNDPDNKYNTFYYKGLPAGPIGSPAIDAVRAAANPDDNNYYFWVTVNLDTGETKFAETYEEHERNVEEYQQWCSDNEGKCS